jgi:hypothetical protein
VRYQEAQAVYKESLSSPAAGTAAGSGDEDE